MSGTALLATREIRNMANGIHRAALRLADIVDAVGAPEGWRVWSQHTGGVFYAHWTETLALHRLSESPLCGELSDGGIAYWTNAQSDVGRAATPERIATMEDLRARVEAEWRRREGSDYTITSASVGGPMAVRLPKPRCVVCGQESTTYHCGPGHTLTWYCGEHAAQKPPAGDVRHDAPKGEGDEA